MGAKVHEALQNWAKLFTSACTLVGLCLRLRAQCVSCWGPNLGPNFSLALYGRRAGTHGAEGEGNQCVVAQLPWRRPAFSLAGVHHRLAFVPAIIT
jgi:hypothetical protein